MNWNHDTLYQHHHMGTRRSCARRGISGWLSQLAGTEEFDKLRCEDERRPCRTKALYLAKAFTLQEDE